MRSRFVAFFVAAVSAAAIAASLEPISIKWSPKAGTTFKYKLDGTATIEIPGQGSGEVTIKGILTQKVTDVKEGQVIIEQKQTDMDIRFMGDSIGDVPPVTNKMTHKANGEVVKEESDAPSDQQSPRMGMSQRFVFPKDAMEVDGTWTHKIEKDAEKGTFTTEYKFTYLGEEEVIGIKCWKITAEVKETDAPTNMYGTGTIWLDVRDGELVKASYDMKKVPINEMIPPADMKANVTRVVE